MADPGARLLVGLAAQQAGLDQHGQAVGQHLARDAGADYFRAPQRNCDEVIGHIPGDLRVIPVATLDDSLAALDAIRTGEGVDDLPVCTVG